MARIDLDHRRVPLAGGALGGAVLEHGVGHQDQGVGAAGGAPRMPCGLLKSAVDIS